MYGMNNAQVSRRSFVVGGAAALAAMAALGMGGLAAQRQAFASEAAETITIQALGADGNYTDVEVPYDPQRVAILDMPALDILGTLGLSERVVGSATTHVDYLVEYIPDDAAELGTIKQADLEAVANCEPDIIFIGGRLKSSYDDLAAIAPVVYLATDSSIGLVESVRKNATTIASIFGLEDQITTKFEDFDDRVAKVKEIGDGSTAVIGMVTSGSFNAIGNTGRLSLIVNECGFENVAVGSDLISDSSSKSSSSSSTDSSSGSSKSKSSSSDSSSSASTESASTSASTDGSSNPHGEEASYETLVSLDPDYMFIMDRDQAIGTEGAAYAQDVMNNDLVNSMRCAQEGHIVYLAHPAVWYTAEGGVTALEVMFDDLYEGLGITE